MIRKVYLTDDDTQFENEGDAERHAALLELADRSGHTLKLETETSGVNYVVPLRDAGQANNDFTRVTPASLKDFILKNEDLILTILDIQE